MKLTEQQYADADTDLEMYCTSCDDLVGGRIEPDAHKAQCPVCDQNTGYGIEEALLMGFLQFVDPEPDD
ncbi:hypothetical protein CMI47_10085 [Candidatus Pacearchaeota archaeon]|nr:hypothetical protein [Candidatus Pacearchaeota archaeon]|tara:strand:+ start:278 stop:484 length:207 start_codon:yes stop_codon:yes gene_type:complete